MLQTCIKYKRKPETRGHLKLSSSINDVAFDCHFLLFFKERSDGIRIRVPASSGKITCAQKSFFEITVPKTSPRKIEIVKMKMK